jgi:1-acyl-sn-glycerol-3-phosphate acyltransferase
MVLIFPEGTRTFDGEIAPFRPGFTALAARSNAAILPVAVEGAFQVWPRTKKYPGLGKIRVHFGKLIPHGEIAGRDERELLAEIERRVRECQTALRQEAKQRSSLHSTERAR